MTAKVRGLGAMVLAVLLRCAHPPPAVLFEPYSRTLEALEPVNLRLPPGGLAGRVVVVQFFATYCFPCLSMLPKLTELQSRYGRQGFLALGVGMDLEGRQMLAPFAEHYQLPFPVLLPSESIRAGTSAFGPIQTLPSTVVLDRYGHPVSAFPGVVTAPVLDALVRAVLQT